MFHSRSSLSNDSPFCEVLIPVFTNSVATPVRLSIWTNVSVTPTGGGDSSYHATMCPRESIVMEWIGESAPSSPKLLTLGSTGLPAPVFGSMVIKPWKTTSPIAVEAYSRLECRSQASPLTVKPTGPISRMSAPVFGSSCTSVLVCVQGPPRTTLLQAPVVPKSN